jgi:hypothetical protein
MISTVINNIRPANEKQKIKYRSFKNLDVIALNEDLFKVNIQVKFKILKHRDFEFVNITSKGEFLQFFRKHVGSFIRLQRSNSSIKSKRVFPLFLHKRS